LDLAADERGERGSTADGRAGPRNHQPDGPAGRIRGRVERPDDEHRDRVRSRRWTVRPDGREEGQGYNRDSPSRLQGGSILMKRKAFGRDAGLSLRMFFTSAMLGLLYVVFAVVLFSVLQVGLAPFQYWTSDKLALAASGAKVVDESQAPELHAMVERLAAMASLPKPRV